MRWPRAKTGTARIVRYHLGTPRAATDSGGTKRWAWPFQSNPFGELAPDEDPEGSGEKFTLNLRFPGQYYDSESGLHYNYFRDYEPQTGRYVQSDPIGIYGGINVWVYAKNSPFSYRDRWGLAPDYSDVGFPSTPFPEVDQICILLNVCPGQEMEFESQRRFEDWVDCNECEIRCVYENMLAIDSLALQAASSGLGSAAKTAGRTALQLGSAALKRANLWYTTYGALITVTCIKDCS